MRAGGARGLGACRRAHREPPLAFTLVMEKELDGQQLKDPAATNLCTWPPGDDSQCGGGAGVHLGLP